MGLFDDLFGSSKETNTQQSSSTSPWAPAMPLINSLFSAYGGLNPGVTANQGGALTKLNDVLSGLPNFGSMGADAISRLFSSADSSGQVGMLNDAYGTLKTNLGETASGANLNPYDTPGFSDALRTATNDITDRVKGVYAASGRDPSGAGSFAGSLGRGLTEGLAPTIASQYGTNYRNMIDANNLLLSGAGSTSSGINNLRSGDTAATNALLQGASAIPGLYSSPAMAQYGAANLQYSQPFQNLAQLLQPSLALAGLGSNSTGTSNTVQTSSPSLISGLGSLLGAGGTALQMAPTGTALFSDARLKEDAEPVGKLNDGQTVWSYRYKGDPTPRIGLIAQEVERVRPEAVHRHPSGFKMVDYGAATRGSRVGALAEAA